MRILELVLQFIPCPSTRAPFFVNSARGKRKIGRALFGTMAYGVQVVKNNRTLQDHPVDVKISSSELSRTTGGSESRIEKKPCDTHGYFSPLYSYEHKEKTEVTSNMDPMRDEVMP